MPLRRARLDALRVLIAHYDTFQEVDRMGIHDLKQALKYIPGIDSLTMSYAPNGNQLFQLSDRITEVGPTATVSEIGKALTNPFVSKDTTMAITGASYLGEQFKAKLQAAKDKITQAQASLPAAIDDLDATAQSALDTAKAIQAEADDLKAALGQGANGGPA